MPIGRIATDPIVRRCTRCGAIDMRRAWPSAEDALGDDALLDWECLECGWPGGELATEGITGAVAVALPRPTAGDEVAMLVGGPRTSG